MDIKYLNKQLFILPSLLSLWLVLSSSLLAWLDPKNFLIAIIFLIISTILCLTHSLRSAGWAIAGIGAVFYFGYNFPAGGLTGNEIRIVSTGAVSLVGAGILGTFTAEQLFQIFTQIKYNRKMIEELRIIDPVSGLIRFHYARKNLNTEVARCQRYNKYLCLLVARIANWNELVEEKGTDGAHQVMSQVGDIFRRSIRNVDLAYINIEKFGVILPETKLEGAIQVAQRIVETCGKKSRVALNIGIASFPGDAIVDTELIRAAEAALQISMSSGQPVVFYSQIQSAIEDSAQEKLKIESSVYPQDEKEENLTEEMILQVLPARRNAALPIVEESVTDADIAETAAAINLETELEAKDDIEIEPEIKSPEATEVMRNVEQPEITEDNFVMVEETVAKPEFLSEIESLDSDKDDALMTKPDVHVPEVIINKKDWVMPYQAPTTNLQLETTEEEDSETAQEPKPLEKEILLGIQGVEQLSDLPELEKALTDLPSVSTVRMVDYSNQTLVLNVKHSSEDIIETLKTGLNLPIQEVRGGDQWIEIILKTTK